MYVKSLFISSCFAVLLSGCYNKTDVIEADQLARTRHHNICLNNGFAEGTIEHANCMKKKIHHVSNRQTLVNELEIERAQDLEIKDNLWRENLVEHHKGKR